MANPIVEPWAEVLHRTVKSLGMRPVVIEGSMANSRAVAQVFEALCRQIVDYEAEYAAMKDEQERREAQNSD